MEYRTLVALLVAIMSLGNLTSAQEVIGRKPSLLQPEKSVAKPPFTSGERSLTVRDNEIYQVSTSLAADQIATNAALANASTADYPNGVWRSDYSNGFGAPPLLYNPGGSACSLNSGAGDNGSQVQSADGKCWIAQLPPLGLDVRDWGVALGNPIHLTVSPSGSDTLLCGIVPAVPCLTITGAQTTANMLNVAGNVVEIDLPANATFTECVSQNGPLIGSVNSRPNPLSMGTTLGPSFLLVKGQDKKTTVWNGCTKYFYTFQASNGGAIGIQNLTIQSTGGNGSQLSFAVQQGGQAFSLGDIIWGASNNVQVWAQDTGSLIILMGKDSIIAGSNSFMNSNGGAAIQMLGYSLPWTAQLNAGLTFGNGFINISNGGQVQDGNKSGHGFTNGIAGSPLILSGNAIFANQTGIALDTLLPTATGPQLSLEYSGARVIPEPPSLVQSSPTGCGSTCTTTIVSQGPRSGFVTITPGGAGISSSGSLTISQGIALMQDGGGASPCIAGITGSGMWNIGAVVQAAMPSIPAGSPKQNFTINWSNNGVNLTSGQSYALSFICSDS
jgi:hypothetical protein